MLLVAGVGFVAIQDHDPDSVASNVAAEPAKAADDELSPVPPVETTSTEDDLGTGATPSAEPAPSTTSKPPLGVSVSGATATVPPMPLHCSCWPSPGIWVAEGNGVPAVA